MPQDKFNNAAETVGKLAPAPPTVYEPPKAELDVTATGTVVADCPLNEQVVVRR
jgi:hypothetical protein